MFKTVAGTALTLSGHSFHPHHRRLGRGHILPEEHRRRLRLRVTGTLSTRAEPRGQRCHGVNAVIIRQEMSAFFLFITCPVDTPQLGQHPVVDETTAGQWKDRQRSRGGNASHSAPR